MKACGQVAWNSKTKLVESKIELKKATISQIKERKMAFYLQALDDNIGEKQRKSFLDHKGKKKKPCGAIRSLLQMVGVDGVF